MLLCEKNLGYLIDLNGSAIPTPKILATLLWKIHSVALSRMVILEEIIG